MSKAKLCLYLLYTWCCMAACQETRPYPLISPLQQTFDVSDASKANVSLVVKSKAGGSLYLFQCHSTGYTGDPDFDYSGDFECRLSSFGKHDAYSTLLTEDLYQERDWESRGRFFAINLQNPCAQVPEFGAMRSFKLRGMELILRIVNPSLTPEGKLKSLKLIVTMNPDPSARRSIAEIVPIPKTGVPPQCKLENYFVDPTTFRKE